MHRNFPFERPLQIYLETLWGEPFQVPDLVSEQLDNLQLVRNSLAHANGNLIIDHDEERRRNIENLPKANVGVTIRENELLITESFLRQCIDSAEHFFNEILGPAGRKYSSLQ